MNMRTTLAVAAACGLAGAAQAQELIRVSYQYSEVQTGTTIPSTENPFDLGPGESVRIQVSLTALRNGTNAIGQTTTYPAPPPPGTGTIRGLSSFLYNLVGDSDATGSWYGRLVSTPFLSGASTGTIQNGGAKLANVGGSQFIAPGATASGVNPVAAAFVGFWTPSSYSSRFVTFRMEAGDFSFGHVNSVLIQYGMTSKGGFADYIGKELDSDFGNGVTIPINIPGPAAPTLFAVASLTLSRRRRSSKTEPLPYR